MFTLKLNLRKPNNYAFFCPVSKVHLTVSSPVGFANEVTPAIFKAVKANTVLDVDGAIDLDYDSLFEDGEADPDSLLEDEDMVNFDSDDVDGE